MSYFQNFCNWIDGLSDLNFALILAAACLLSTFWCKKIDKKGE